MKQFKKIAIGLAITVTFLGLCMTGYLYNKRNESGIKLIEQYNDNMKSNMSHGPQTGEDVTKALEVLFPEPEIDEYLYHNEVVTLASNLSINPSNVSFYNCGGRIGLAMTEWTDSPDKLFVEESQDIIKVFLSDKPDIYAVKVRQIYHGDLWYSDIVLNGEKPVVISNIDRSIIDEDGMESADKSKWDSAFMPFGDIEYSAFKLEDKTILKINDTFLSVEDQVSLIDRIFCLFSDESNGHLMVSVGNNTVGMNSVLNEFFLLYISDKGMYSDVARSRFYLDYGLLCSNYESILR